MRIWPALSAFWFSKDKIYMFGIIIALISSSFHAASNILDAHIAGNIFKRLPTIIFYSGVTNCLALPVLLFLEMPTAIPLAILPYFILTVLIEIIYLPLYYTALKRVDTSIVAAMFSMGKIVVPVLAYFLVNERLCPLQYIGFGIVILFNILLNVNVKQKFKIDLSFWLMLFVSVIISVQSVLYKKIFEQMDWVNVAFYTIIFFNFFIALFFLHAASRHDICASFKTYLKNWKVFFALEFTDRMGILTSLVAISLLPVMVQKGISSIQPIFVLLYGFILYKLFGDKFKEDITAKNMMKKFICFVFIIIGIILTIGNP